MNSLKATFIITLIIFVLFYSIKAKSSTNRMGKLFPFWGFGVGLVRFENSICNSTDGLQGTCYTRRQCSDNNGQASGTCASGIGVCCVFQSTCGGVSSLNNTYFVSPNFPGIVKAGGATCSLTIQRSNYDICQIRLDFLTFNLAQSDATGACLTDAFNVIGGASPIPTLCGDNTGQYIYVDFNSNSTIQLLITSFSSSPWNIRITQIGCNCPTKAPTGCLQYFRGITTGTVKSFNYGITGTQMGTRQLINQNYGVCVEMLPGYCSITWAQTAADVFSFTVTGDTNTAIGMANAGTAAAAVIGINCLTDFVIVPNPTFTATGIAVGSDRFCGNAFQSVTTTSKPFVLTVITNANENGDQGNRGFSLTFMQNRCTNVVAGG